MKVLLDHNVPAQLKRFLKGHSVFTTREMRWERLLNGDLLTVAKESGFAAMVTGDQGIPYQTNTSLRTVSLIVITQTKRRILLAQYELVQEAISRARPGSYELLLIPTEPQGLRTVE